MTPLQTYFDGEKQGALAIGAIGLLALALGIWAWSSQSTFRAIVFPLGLLAIAEVGIGVGLFLKTPPQVAALERGLSEKPAEAREGEHARMVKVMRSFEVIKLVELVLIAIGLALVFAARSRPALVGVGLGLLLQAAALLVFDTFAEERGRVYVAWLRSGEA